MSADNWTTCPRCMERAKAEKALAQERALRAYGEAPVEEFDRLRAEADKPLGVRGTFREDYEFYGADEGYVTASYSGECSACGLTCEFKHTERFWPDNTQESR